MSNPSGDQRDELIEAVKYGRMKPDEAESEAVRLGLGKFAREPEPAQFNPAEETWWTLQMTVAWIVWRTLDKVRAYWSKYRRECWDWHYREWRIGPEGTVHSGYFLEQRRNASLWFMRREETYDAAKNMLPHETTAANAEGKLWDALEQGVIEATAIDLLTQRRITIPSVEWRDLQVFHERDRDVVRVWPSGGLPNGGYEEVLFKRAKITAMWLAPRPEHAVERPLILIKPEGAGYLPLCSAAYWIATRGGQSSIDPSDSLVWESAFAELLARIASEEVTVTGVHAGEREKIAGYVFAGIHIDYPFSDSPIDPVASDELYLYAGVYLDEEHWQRGFDDKLETRRAVKWGKLLVLKSDVARWWPFASATSLPEDLAPVRTGAPGRPS